MIPITAPSMNPMQLALKRVDQLTGLFEVARALSAGKSRAELLELVLRESTRGVGAERAVLFLLGEGGALRSEGATAALAAPAGQGLLGAVVQGGDPVRVNAVKSEPRYHAATDALGVPAVGSFVAVPLRDRAGKVIGVFAAVHEAEDHFEADAVELLDAMAGLAAAALR